tara:strand:- start:2027 stop:2728 length:702 start_codon:yes stop_codon:yes gene_type:complete
MIQFIKNRIKRIIEYSLEINKQNKSSIDLYLEEISKECYDYLKAHFRSSNIFKSKEDIRSFAISKAMESYKNNNLFIEFGVFKGHSINFLAKKLKKKNLSIFGFDSFAGLEEDWIADDYNPVGTFAIKKTPKVLDNVNLVVGPVQNTLENFLKEQSDKKIIFIHFDMDNYKPTKFVLEKVKTKLEKGAIIIFDEFHDYPNWKNHEFKALQEVFKESEYNYIGFSKRQAVIKLN